MIHVAMPPEHHLLEHEEGDDAARERDSDAMRPGARIERVWQEREERGAEQRAGRKTHEVRQQGVSSCRRQQHEAAGDERRQGAAGSSQQDDGCERRHADSLPQPSQARAAMRPVAPSRRYE